VRALVVVLLGGGAGFGLCLIGYALTRDRSIGLDELRELTGGRGTPLSLTGWDPAARAQHLAPGGLRGTIGKLGARYIGSVGFTDLDRLDEQLRVLDRSLERHAYEKILAAVAGFAVPILASVAMAAGGVSIPVLWALVFAVVLGVGGFLYPDLPLAEQVEARRREFRHALSAYLDLVSILMAGGAGIESSLVSAAEDGAGWAFDEIRWALHRAEVTRATPWESFDQLGEDLGVRELQDLAANVSTAGEFGARIRQTLSAKADAMRASQAAELEAEAERQTERMLIPLIALAFGVSLFVGYGAIQAITTDGTQTSTPTTNPQELSP
jgi:Flp pilus assembly protein TadB